MSKKKENVATDVEIVRTGHQVILPEGMTFDEGIMWLQRKQEEDERIVSFKESIPAYPLDGSHALMLALKRKYGWVDLNGPPGWFGPTPPLMIAVETAPNVTVQVPWGRIQVPKVGGYVDMGFELRNGRPAFMLTGKCPQKDKAKWQEIAKMTKEALATDSLYRGKALRVDLSDINPREFNPETNMPRFMDLSSVKPDELIFPEATQAVIQDALFTPIERTGMARAAKVPLKRGVLLEGPYGVGKTLTANVTAKKCVDNGWTFIYIASVDQLSAAYDFAKQYQPAVIFAEDVDRVVSGPRDRALDSILNVIDGVDTKDIEVITVLTTNHIEKINKAMLRPGRLDAVVSVRPPDRKAVEALLRLYGRGLLSPMCDLGGVATMLAGQIPAVIREVVERAKLSALGTLAQGERMLLNSKHLERAATGMLTQVALVKVVDEKEPTPAEQLGEGLGRALAGTLHAVNTATAPITGIGISVIDSENQVASSTAKVRNGRA